MSGSVTRLPPSRCDSNAAQIISIVDIFDALTTVRPYRRALGEEAASGQLLAESRRRWLNAELVSEFNAMVREHRLPVKGEDAELRARYGHARPENGK